MSDTPRTDDQAIKIMFGMLDTVVPVEFARQLETELADALAEIERLQGKENEADALLRKCLHLLEEQIERGGV